MSGRIPQSFIDDLVSRVDIAEVIGERVKLKKGGRDLKACCPFHEEKSPSFTVSPSKQFYHCFGCGAHGTVLGFLMEYERLDFVDAVEELAGRLGLEVPREGGGEDSVAAPRHDALYAALEAAGSFYASQLRSHPQASRAVDYLKGRGLSGAVARDFAIGFAPPGWDNLVGALRDRHGEETLVDAGLAVRKERGSVYDRFRDRVMFPIRDSRGRIIAFGGRVMDPEQSPKYLNSSETPVFHKGRELYGLWEARRSSRQVQRLLVVEGYMDVVALAQSGIGYGVATLGTAATPDHIERLFRVTSNVVFAFDGDAAGRRAAARALEIVLPALRDGREVGFLFLPEGEDPDSRVRTIGRDSFEAEVDAAVSALEFLFSDLERDLRHSPEAHARLVEQASTRLREVPGEALREVAKRRLAAVAGVSFEQLGELTRAAPPKRPDPARDAGQDSTQSGGTRVRHAIRLLLNYPAVSVEAKGDWRRLASLERPGAGLLLAMIEVLRDNPNMSTGSLVERFREHPEGRHLARIAAAGPPPGDEAQMAAEFLDVLAGLNRELEEQRFRLLSATARVQRLSAAEQREFLELIAKAPGAVKPVGQ